MAKHKPKVRVTFCSLCHGNGCIRRKDKFRGWIGEPCRECQGTGVVPVKGAKR